MCGKDLRVHVPLATHVFTPPYFFRNHMFKTHMNSNHWPSCTLGNYMRKYATYHGESEVCSTWFAVKVYSFTHLTQTHLHFCIMTYSIYLLSTH